ncbi:hypothetical protein [Pseudobacteriovorax antillogorgiicola]|uniref:N-acetyltransferase domain-containing protein n=1 Tax=Pseudobacteriovorax antillogorgiicola TaxID=1513793 RepID=A0A1Y6CMA1_9BACT|nr:hypothetical protein [Pseudobacteriovorax antillogorgiicola]TCS47657.1 hypothetical protein EDD56_12098 [Pseudobacteriovorax antillogorgiicola]SMF59797.1 hypothetical protein SAMN06296036_12042 [Pseudobacteriovorax antillogorgiicola]
MEIKQLDNEYQKYLFLREYNQRAKMNVPAEYIFDCQVYGAFIDGQMVGGFAFALGQDMAWPQVLPDSQNFFHAVPQKFCLEINLVWAKGKLHDSYQLMMKFWLTVTHYAGSISDIDYITFAVDARHEYLVRLYERLSLGRIYEGDVPKYPGRRAVVFYTSPFRCKYAKYFCIREFFIRYKRKQCKSRNREEALETSFLPTKAS